MPAPTQRTHPPRVKPRTGLIIPFAMLNGRMVAPHQVITGLACGCVCPCCGAPVMAKALDSRDRRPHFSHHGRSGCSGGVESALHRMAKQVIADHREVLLPAWEGTSETPNPPTRVNSAGETVTGISVDIPARMAALTAVSVEDRTIAVDYRPDVLVRDRDGDLLIEIRVSHRVDSLKQRRVQADGRRMLEIDLSALLVDGMSLAKLKHAVLYAPNNRNWLSHPVATEAWRENWTKLKVLVAAMDRGIAAGRQEQAQRNAPLRARMRAMHAQDLERLASLASPEARSSRLAELQARDAPLVAVALSQLPAALQSAVLCPHVGDWAYSAAPALWKAIVVVERILPMHRGNTINHTDLARWVRETFGVPAPIWRLYLAQHAGDMQETGKGWRPQAWYLTDEENASIPDPEGAVAGLLARLAAESVLRRLRGRPGVYVRV